MKVKARAWKNAAKMLKEYYGLDVTVDEVRAVVEDDSYLLDELKHESFTDTCVREKLADAVAQKRIGMDMPCYGDDPAYTVQFNTRMAVWRMLQSRRPNPFKK